MRFSTSPRTPAAAADPAIGIGALYLLPKFISADGGLARLTWTTAAWRRLGDKLLKRCAERACQACDKEPTDVLPTSRSIQHLAAVSMAWRGG
jgi:hypothetical protein